MSLNLKSNEPFNRGDIFYIAPNQTIKFDINSTDLNNNDKQSRTVEKHQFLAYRTFSYTIGPDHSNRLIKPLFSSENNFSISKLNDETTNPLIIDNFNNDGIILKKKKNSNIDVKNLNHFEILFEVESEMDGFF